MSSTDFVRQLPGHSKLPSQTKFTRFHLDPLLLLSILLVVGAGLIVLYSAVDRNMAIFNSQLIRLGLALIALVIAAQLEPRFYLRWAPFVYAGGLVLLILVLVMGTEVKGSQRWLSLPGLPQFQPSELMKISVPLMIAWYLHDRPLPPSFKDLMVALVIAVIPAALVVIQPDLGTAILVIGAGAGVIVLSGVYWRWIMYALLMVAAAAPGLWYFLQDYQKKRIMTLFDPESDPLGAGWNIIQSKTAIGSGGLFGKGLFAGTQSRLDFLPESQTDFIIAVIGEELGLVGVTSLLGLYLLIIARGLYLSSRAPNTFGRLLSGGLIITFFVYIFVNIAMVSGLLPVVGVPLPLVSYGGTSAITLMAGFGLVMSIHTHRGW